MNKSGAVMIAMAICMLAAGCAATDSGTALPESSGIAAIETLQPQDVTRIVVEQGANQDVLSDTYDIAVCLTDFKSIRLTEAADGAVGDGYRSFQFQLKNGGRAEVRIGNGYLAYGGEVYHYDESGSPVTKGSVTLWTQGTAYEPYAWWVSSLDLNGACADGTWFGVQALEDDGTVETELGALEEIPYAEDFAFECVWEYDPEQPVRHTYSVFDASLQRISHYTSELLIPGEPGLYYISVNIGWGTAYRSVGYNYIF